jgi:hypothetical protein
MLNCARLDVEFGGIPLPLNSTALHGIPFALPRIPNSAEGELCGRRTRVCTVQVRLNNQVVEKVDWAKLICKLQPKVFLVSAMVLVWVTKLRVCQGLARTAIKINESLRACSLQYQ